MKRRKNKVVTPEEAFFMPPKWAPQDMSHKDLLNPLVKTWSLYIRRLKVTVGLKDNHLERYLITRFDCLDLDGARNHIMLADYYWEIMGGR